MAFVSTFTTGFRNGSVSSSVCSQAPRVVKSTIVMQNDTKPKRMPESEVLKGSMNVNESGSGTFGFTLFSEQWNGRMAMLGLVAATVNELRTGQGMLGQLGLNQSQGWVLLFVMTGFSLFASLGYVTVKKASQLDAKVGKDNSGENF